MRKIVTRQHVPGVGLGRGVQILRGRQCRQAVHATLPVRFDEEERDHPPRLGRDLLGIGAPPGRNCDRGQDGGYRGYRECGSVRRAGRSGGRERGKAVSTALPMSLQEDGYPRPALCRRHREVGDRPGEGDRGYDKRYDEPNQP